MLIPKTNIVNAITQWNFIFILSSSTGNLLFCQLQGTSIVNSFPKRTISEHQEPCQTVSLIFFNHLEWMKHIPAGNFVQIWPRLRTLGVWPTSDKHLLLERNIM